MRRIRLLTLLLAVAAVLSTGVAASATSYTEPRSGPRIDGSDWRTEQRTRAFLRAFEGEDLRAVAAMLSPEVTLTMPITFSGAQEPDTVFVGREQVLGYFESVFATMRRIDFVDVRVSIVTGGRTSFVEAKGDLSSVDGRPYRNVYVFRFDWLPDGRIAGGAEYANPITYCQTFPESPAC